ncbi:MAG: GNAT family N-acetyltransferase [Devosia sp.]
MTFLPNLHSADEDRWFIENVVMQNCGVTVAESDGAITGFLAESPGWVEHLYVDPARLRGGVGSALLAGAMSRQDQLELWCFTANVRGRAFYERHGFVALEHTDGSRNEERVPDIRYRWARV